ncbi:MAG: DUF2017 domain-containing protein [Actinomycetota bacterium]|nr:DUF2017 domain-containing protein [Actinomycetota bacterium]
MGGRVALRRRADGTFGWNLAKNERDVLTHLARDFRALLTAETPSSDPSLQRLFPPARTDDPIEELEYERKVGDGLLATKLEQLNVLERCAGSRVLTEEDVLACMRAVNDLRLVLGTRLDVQEDSDPSDFARDPERRSTFELYAYLSWLLESLIDAMSGAGP